MTAILSTLNSQYELKQVDSAESQSLLVLKQRFLWGSQVLEKVVDSLFHFIFLFFLFFFSFFKDLNYLYFLNRMVLLISLSQRLINQ